MTESENTVKRIMATVEETFGNRWKAQAWLRRPNTALNGKTPMSLCESEQGAATVEALLGWISHGIAA